MTEDLESYLAGRVVPVSPDDYQTSEKKSRRTGTARPQKSKKLVISRHRRRVSEAHRATRKKGQLRRGEIEIGERRKTFTTATGDEADKVVRVVMHFEKPERKKNTEVKLAREEIVPFWERRRWREKLKLREQSSS